MTALLLIFLLNYYVDPAVPSTLVYPPFGHCMGIYRAGTEQLAILLGGLVRFDNPQGLACVKLYDWDDPGSSDDDELAVYGVNSGTGHIIYNADMYTLGLYGGTGSDEDELLRPHGIAADPSGMVLVADTGNQRVMILRRNGSRLVPDGQISGSFIEPWDVAIDGDGKIYITDRAGNALLIYSSVSDSLPDVIELNSPGGVDAVGNETWFHNDERSIAVITDEGSTLLKIENGVTVESVDIDYCGGGIFNYPAIDFWGNIWVTDSLSSSIHKFTPDLEYLVSFGSEGHDDREFTNPTGLAVWRRFGQIFVAESEGAKYFWVGADLIDVSIESTGRGLQIDGILTENAIVDAIITGPDGSEVRRICEGRHSAGQLHLQWDGCTSRGLPVEGGEFSLELVLQPTYSSKGYFSKTFLEDFMMDSLPDAAPGRGRGS
ncbi:MAG: hypothetical protein KAQ97_10820 [Candidatus Fermentibacteraceae bacterium]|nr:hypothetical protein [Candidatus Fermentibacteraceae bacterium]